MSGYLGYLGYLWVVCYDICVSALSWYSEVWLHVGDLPYLELRVGGHLGFRVSVQGLGHLGVRVGGYAVFWIKGI